MAFDGSGNAYEYSNGYVDGSSSSSGGTTNWINIDEAFDSTPVGGIIAVAVKLSVALVASFFSLLMIRKYRRRKKRGLSNSEIFFGSFKRMFKRDRRSSKSKDRKSLKKKLKGREKERKLKLAKSKERGKKERRTKGKTTNKSGLAPLLADDSEAKKKRVGKGSQRFDWDQGEVGAPRLAKSYSRKSPRGMSGMISKNLSQTRRSSSKSFAEASLDTSISAYDDSSVGSRSSKTSSRRRSRSTPSGSEYVTKRSRSTDSRKRERSERERSVRERERRRGSRSAVIRSSASNNGDDKDNPNSFLV